MHAEQVFTSVGMPAPAGQHSGPEDNTLTKWFPLKINTSPGTGKPTGQLKKKKRKKEKIKI